MKASKRSRRGGPPAAAGRPPAWGQGEPGHPGASARGLFPFWPILCAIVLLVGVVLRIAFFASAPPALDHDGHLDSILEVVRTGRPADPTRFFQGYHPPLYHTLAAGLYRSVAGRKITDENWAVDQLQRFHGPAATVDYLRVADLDPSALPAQPGVAEPLSRHRSALRAVQGISLIASLATLFCCWGVLVAVFPGNGPATLAGVALAALWPRAIYQSAIMNNEALAAGWSALAVYLLVRYLQGRGLLWAGLAGLACGLTLLTKGTGLALLPAIAAAFITAIFAARRKGRSDPGPGARAVTRLVAGGAIMLGIALLLGAPHYVRMGLRYGNPFIGNFDARLFPSSHLKEKPPGADLRLFEARPTALWRHVFVHTSTVASWPAAVYGSFWYDYEPAMTLWRDPGMRAHITSARPTVVEAGGPTVNWDRLLDWPAASMSPELLSQGRMLYAAGLPITLLIFLGALTLGAYHQNAVHALLGTLLAASGAMLLALAVREPTFSSFKAAYILVAQPALAVFAAQGCDLLRRRGGRFGAAVVVLAGLGLAVATVRHFSHLATALRGAPSVWEMESKFFEPNLRSADQMLAQGRPREAEMLYRVVADIRPESPLPWIGLGDARLAIRDAKGAETSYRKALSLVANQSELATELERKLARLAGGPRGPDK